MKILVIDGKGGRLGAGIVSMVKSTFPNVNVIGVGTNGIATSQMIKAGADDGATGEHPIIVQSRKAEVIIAPIGIVICDSFCGEVSPKMSQAVGESFAKKIFIPNNKCNHYIVGAKDMSLSESIDLVKIRLKEIIE